MNAPELGVDVHGPADGPVLVLGNSLGTTHTVWDPVMPTLAERFRVIRYDHVGHGGSAVPPGPYTVAGLADAVAGMLDDHGVTRAHVAGLSLGGIVGMQLAASYPHLVDRLAVVCSSAHLPPAQQWHDRAASVRAHGTAEIAEQVLRRWFTPAFATSAAAAAVRQDLLGTPREGYAACCEAIAAMDLRPLLGTIRAPVLAIAGADDPATPPEHAQAIVAGVLSGGAPARVEIVADAAHLAPVERPNEVGTLLLTHFTA
jgi:3-oxoadipate enol-lactonase